MSLELPKNFDTTIAPTEQRQIIASLYHHDFLDRKYMIKMSVALANAISNSEIDGYKAYLMNILFFFEDINEILPEKE